MSPVTTSLPAGFEALQPFVDFWAAESAAGRAHCRDSSAPASRRAFYQAAAELAPRALEYLDSRPLKELTDSERRLMQLILCFGHVAMAEELQKEDEPKHAQYRPFMRITRAPADDLLKGD